MKEPDTMRNACKIIITIIISIIIVIIILVFLIDLGPHPDTIRMNSYGFREANINSLVSEMKKWL